MALDTQPTEKSIMDRAKTVMPRCYVSEVPAGLTPPMPYAVVFFGEPMRIAKDHHLTSTRNDTLRGYVTFRVISRDDASANAVKNAIRNALTGFIPVDSSEMRLEGGMGYSGGNAELQRYYREVGFSYFTNLTWVD